MNENANVKTNFTARNHEKCRARDDDVKIKLKVGLTGGELRGLRKNRSELAAETLRKMHSAARPYIQNVPSKIVTLRLAGAHLTLGVFRRVPRNPLELVCLILVHERYISLDYEGIQYHT